MEITFKGTLVNIGPIDFIRIPLSLSGKLPSRGMVMGRVVINNIEFILPLEPDGKGSHFIEINELILNEVGIQVGDKVNVNIEPLDEWIEPEIPKDMMEGIINSNVLNQWNSITTKAKWDWIRWIRSTNNVDTRNKRINVACSKLLNGDKNPCCFDRTRCTIPSVSKSGVLLD